jgi:hypothetical protein
MKPAVLFHTHGLGPFDFSEIGVGDLLPIDAPAARRGCCYAPRSISPNRDLAPSEVSLKSLRH